MADDDDNKTALASIVEGGLPRIVAGPAGHALSRLVGSVTDIGAAWFKGIEQGLTDRTEARSSMTKALSDAAMALAVQDPDLVNRAMSTMLSREIRSQKNKDAVAITAYHDLLNDSPPENGIGPEDDWLNAFERLAEEASSESLQKLFGLILAGEIRQPGTISRLTLQMASYLNADLAKQIEVAASQTTPDGGVLDSNGLGKFIRPDYSALAEIGFMTAPTLLMSWAQKTDQTGVLELNWEGDRIFRAKYSEKTAVSFPARHLTHAGKELVRCLKLQPDIDFFAEKFRNSGADIIAA